MSPTHDFSSETLVYKLGAAPMSAAAPDPHALLLLRLSKLSGDESPMPQTRVARATRMRGGGRPLRMH
jgi:hypothetical protein